MWRHNRNSKPGENYEITTQSRPHPEQAPDLDPPNFPPFPSPGAWRFGNHLFPHLRPDRSGWLRAAKCSDGPFQPVAEPEPFGQPEPYAQTFAKPEPFSKSLTEAFAKPKPFAQRVAEPFTQRIAEPFPQCFTEPFT